MNEKTSVKKYSKLSIIVPTYNERNTIREIIRLIQKVKIPLKKEIIIIDDGSTDGTKSIVKEDILSEYSNIKFYGHQKNMGKGFAIRTALNYCTGDIVIIQDADLEYDPEYYDALIKPIIEGEVKIVFGSRYLYKKIYGHVGSTSLLFKIGGFLITHIFNLIYQSNITDEPSCYKVFDSDVINQIKLDCRRFEFCPEVAAKIVRLGYKIKEVPISYEPRSVEEGKKIRIKDGLEATYVMLKYRFIRKASFIKKKSSDLESIVPEYNSSNPLVRKLFIDRLHYAIDFSKIRSNQKILDVGTGNGILLNMLSLRYRNNQYVGLDTNRLILELKLPNTEFVVGNVRKMEFKANTFDLVYCLDVLEHIKELNQALSEIKRVLKPAGQLIVSVPKESFLYKAARFLIKGTFSQETGPCVSPHFWNAKQLIGELNKNFNLKKKKALYKLFSFFQILSYENEKKELGTIQKYRFTQTV